MAEKVRKKSILMTPDPYHTPGYGGYCPQFKYRYGETFGKMTSRLLTDRDVSSSGDLVLARLHPEDESEKSGSSRAAKVRLLKERTQSWGDQKLLPTMIPGYTGFIPKSQHYFPNRYTENSLNAICDFECEQRRYAGKRKEMESIQALQSGHVPTADPTGRAPALPLIRSKYTTPLRPLASSMSPFSSKSSPPSRVSPYDMSDDDPMKSYISGYTGFVPRSRGMLGAGYPLITHNALKEFTSATDEHKKINHEPVTVHQPEVATPDTKPIYLPDSGLVPHYTGHIPGQKFRYGNTFGHSTAGVISAHKSISV